MSIADDLSAGQRGRRVLLEFALVSAERDALGSAVSYASRRLDPVKGTILWIGTGGGSAPEEPEVSPADVAAVLAASPLRTVTPTLLRECLFRSVDAARYWQPADGSDLLAATDEVRSELRRVAEHIAASPHADAWHRVVDVDAQWAVDWDGIPSRPRSVSPSAVLADAHDAEILAEIAAARERPVDPEANWSGDWWSRPPWELPSSSGVEFDGCPTKLWYVEDSLGWEGAEAHRLDIPDGLRIYEIDSADAWAELCTAYPLEVTAQKRHDWYRTTGRTGRWVVPDWVRVAEHYDAVHLQTRAYLAAAGTAIDIGDGTASVIAGWDPDQTYWFSPRIRDSAEATRWTLTVDDRVEWRRASM